jgi:hypothetical protein
MEKACQRDATGLSFNGKGKEIIISPLSTALRCFSKPRRCLNLRNIPVAAS